MVGSRRRGFSEPRSDWSRSVRSPTSATVSPLRRLATFLPTVVVALAFFFLPETKGLEPEDLWPESTGLSP